MPDTARVVIAGLNLFPVHAIAVLYLNPGSPAPRRFRLPVSVARIIELAV